MGKRIQQKILGGEKKSNLSKNILPWKKGSLDDKKSEELIKKTKRENTQN